MENNNTLPSDTFLGPTQLFDRAWIIFEKKWKMALIIALPMVIALLIVFGLLLFGGLILGSGITHNLAGVGIASIVTGIIFYILFLIGCLWVQLAEMYLIVHHNEEVTFTQAYKNSRQYLLSYIWVSLLVAVIYIAGLMAFVIPGIILILSFTFAHFVLVDQNIRGLNALLVSREYVRGRWWGVFGRNVAFGLIYGILIILLSSVSGAIEESGRPALSNLVGLITAGVQLILGFLMLLYTYSMYENLKAIKGTSIPIAASTRKKFTAMGILGGLSMIFLAVLLVMRSPAALLPLGRDAARYTKLIETQAALTSYYAKNKEYPQSLNELKDKGLLEDAPVDPKTSTPFRYVLTRSGMDYMLCTILENPPGSNKRASVTVNTNGEYCVNSKGEVPPGESMMQYAPGAGGTMLEGRDASGSGQMMPAPGTRFMNPEDGSDYPPVASDSDLMRY